MTVQNNIRTAPELPGCYLFKDRFGHIIYAGKAKNLRKRVRQYFRAGTSEWSKLKKLAGNIADVEYRITGTELDALLLEYRLIKEFRPAYNSRMKAEPEYPWLRIATDAPWPGISVVSEWADGAACYGCFYDRYEAKEAVELLNRAWRTPVCGKAEFGASSRACLYYHLGKCVAPCERRIQKEDYRALISELTRFLEGEPCGKETELKTLMDTAVRELAFEKAGEIRDTLRDLERLRRKAGKPCDITRIKRLVLFLRPFRSPEYSVFYFCGGALHCRRDRLAGSAGNGTGPDPGTATFFLSAHMEDFLAACRTASGPLPESEWLSRAVTEISAERQFVILPEREDAGTETRLLLEACLAWERSPPAAPVPSVRIGPITSRTAGGN